ncbi:MAG: glycoside hydrolase family protein [Parcubacteria group bacterium GW2011_GWA2_43_17]|nr:MAG: glycoside hydrolase family protein [Parcubacteria group bacterium GW2011_GWA2_43_17]OHB42131.1 MAG: hypothetical protein A2Y13_07450 [Planctomycetes bacterium GWC2_45_44]
MGRILFGLVPDEMKLFCQIFVDEFCNGFDRYISIDLVKIPQSRSLEVRFDGDRYVITYNEALQVARGIGAILAGLVKEGQIYQEKNVFKKLGVMLDCSRNAVMKVESVKRWLRQLSLMGYNLLMLYTEDTYELSGEPYFGYLRGRYLAAELKEIDAYAASLNIEVVGCIQTLGHLTHLLKWDAYKNVKDTAAVLLVDHPETYALIEKMVKQMSDCIISRRIHIGMDETFDLGLGEFLHRHGYKKQKEIYNRHLNKVVAICKKYSLKPMIWSDMYFRTSMEPYENYDPHAEIPEHVAQSIPDDVEFVFWDYYKEDKQYYVELIKRHRELGKGPLVASGIWTWARFWYDKNITMSTAGPCIDACLETNVQELLLTMWGDGGAYCEFDSAMAGLAWVAEKALAGDSFNEESLEQKFQMITSRVYKDVITACDLNNICDLAAYMWDDPILGCQWKQARENDSQYWLKAIARCNELLVRLKPLAVDTGVIDFNHAYNLAVFLKSRIEVGLKLDDIVDSCDSTKVTKAIGLCRTTIGKLDLVLESFRRQWYRRNKVYGFEDIQNRFGGLKQRLMELESRLGQLQDGEKVNIPEWRE